MGEEKTFRIVGGTVVRARANAAFWSLHSRLKVVLPQGTEIFHVGATAIPNCQTKGDLDILIRVDCSNFCSARDVLRRMFKRNIGSYQSAYFEAFETTYSNLPVGLELVVRNSPLDVFIRFRDALKADPAMVFKYNQLKRRCNGQSTRRYRMFKSAFVENVLRR